MKAHYLQHVPFEGPGYIETWLEEKGIPLGCTRLFAGERLPEMEQFDFLIIMGGPMSVNDEAEFPWLAEEKAFIRAAIENRKSVLGICLGAQLIANCLGARVYPGQEKEIGWFPIESVDPSSPFPKTVTVFHWHGETFDLPEGAIHFARSEACKNQAFGIGESVLGLQLHLETTAESLESMLENDGGELAGGRWIQGAEEIILRGRFYLDSANREMGAVLERLLSMA